MSEAPQICYGCPHLDYRGPASLWSRPDVQGTAIPRCEEDRNLGSGEYRCRKLRDANRKPRMIGVADKVPRELEEGCKEVR